MVKKLSKDHLRKLKNGLKESRERKKESFFTLNSSIKIGVDEYQYILKRSGRTNTYHPDIESLVDELLCDDLRDFLSAKDIKTIKELKQIMSEHREWVMTTIKDACLARLERTIKIKNKPKL